MMSDADGPSGEAPRRKDDGATGGPGRSNERGLASSEVGPAQLLAVRDDERRRIALELQDSMGRHLGALGLTLARMRQLPNDIQHLVLLDEMSERLREATQDTRVIANLMTPRDLLGEGLAASVRSMADGLARRSGLAIGVQVAGPVDEAPPEAQRAAFRIAQEALLNVHRHAGARSVQLALSSAEGMLSVRVADDGCGLPDEPAIGLGIAGMRAQAAQSGGRLDLTSSSGGACVAAELPIGASDLRP